MAWRPFKVENIRALGFHIDDLAARFGEACEKLGVVRVSEIDRGYWGKSFGAVV